MQPALEKTGNRVKQIRQDQRDQKRADNELEFDQQGGNDRDNGQRNNQFCG